MTILFNLSFGKFYKPKKNDTSLNKPNQKKSMTKCHPSGPSQSLDDIPEYHQIKQKQIVHNVSKPQPRKPVRTISFSFKSTKKISQDTNYHPRRRLSLPSGLYQYFKRSPAAKHREDQVQAFNKTKAGLQKTDRVASKSHELKAKISTKNTQSQDFKINEDIHSCYEYLAAL